MTVPGENSLCKHGPQELIEITCKPCEDDGKYTNARGFCSECEENMCELCFGHHRKAKVCKDHVMIFFHDEITEKNERMTDVGVEMCQEHRNEHIKYYCTDHDQIGCGVCMNFEHKLCKVEYLPHKTKEFKDGQLLDIFVNEVSECNLDIQHCLYAIKNNRSRVEEIHVKFINDAMAFKNKIVQQVNELTVDICGQAGHLKTQNMKYVDELEENLNDMVRDMSLINETLKAQRKQPNNLLLTALQFKPKIKAFQQLANDITTCNKIQEYTFHKSDQLVQALKFGNYLGLVQRSSGADDVDNCIVTHGEVQSRQQTASDIPTVKQPPLDQKLRANNIDVDGDYLSFSSFNVTRVQNGLYIGNTAMTTGSYFEVEIIKCWGSDGSVVIGLVPKDYPGNAFPGWYKSSAGYHSDDGRIFIESDFGKPLGQTCGNYDRMGCGIAKKSIRNVNIFFTKNGKKVISEDKDKDKIWEQALLTGRNLYPAVALDTFGQKVKVMLAAQQPKP